MSILNIPTARIFKPLLVKSRYKAAFGGRGSAKSHFFAELLVKHHVMYPSLRSVCIREVQKTLAQSAKRIIEDKISMHGLEKKGFKILKDRIITPGNGLIIFQGMQDHTAESIKSLEGFGIAWVEEAQTLSKRSLELLRPTIRDSGIPDFESELWFSWNPTRKTDAVDLLFRGENGAPTDSIVVHANWNNNPWFPDVLEQERKDDLQQRPDSYGHVWEGDYIKVVEGAYFATNLAMARIENRIGFFPKEPFQIFRVFVDIGGTGAKADAFAMWVVQFIGQKILVIDHYEAVGQEFKDHVYWLQKNKYKSENTNIYLPHDGGTNDRLNRTSYKSEFRKLGYEVDVTKNQGTGAANARIEAIRAILHRCFFDESKCIGGLEALGWYHEKKHAITGIGLGPEHDWSSHSSDAFGLMAINVDRLTSKRIKTTYTPDNRNKGSTGWMGN